MRCQIPFYVFDKVQEKTYPVFDKTLIISIRDRSLVSNRLYNVISLHVGLQTLKVLSEFVADDILIFQGK